MEILLLDASVYIASLKSKDIFYKQTRKFLLSLQGKMPEIITPSLVMLETANILKTSISDTFLIFKDSLVVDLDLDLVREIIPFFKKINLKTSDAVIAAAAKIFKTDLISWDKKLVKESRKLVKAYTPTEYLEKFEKIEKEY